MTKTKGTPLSDDARAMLRSIADAPDENMTLIFAYYRPDAPESQISSSLTHGALKTQMILSDLLRDGISEVATKAIGAMSLADLTDILRTVTNLNDKKSQCFCGQCKTETKQTPGPQGAEFGE